MLDIVFQGFIICYSASEPHPPIVLERLMRFPLRFAPESFLAFAPHKETPKLVKVGGGSHQKAESESEPRSL